MSDRESAPSEEISSLGVLVGGSPAPARLPEPVEAEGQSAGVQHGAEQNQERSNGYERVDGNDAHR